MFGFLLISLQYGDYKTSQPFGDILIGMRWDAECLRGFKKKAVIYLEYDYCNYTYLLDMVLANEM